MSSATSWASPSPIPRHCTQVLPPPPRHRAKTFLGMLRPWWFPPGAPANPLLSPMATVRPDGHRDRLQQYRLIFADQSISPTQLHLSWVKSKLNPPWYVPIKGQGNTSEVPTRLCSAKREGWMRKFLSQLKLCSITNRWEPFTGRAGASISLELYNTPGLAPTHPLCSRSCTLTQGRPTPLGKEITLPKHRPAKPRRPPSRVVPMLLPNIEEVLGEHLPPTHVRVHSPKHRLYPKPP